MTYRRAMLIAGTALLLPTTTVAAQSPDIEALRSELAQARAEIGEQRQQLQSQEARIQSLETRLDSALSALASARPAQPQQVAAAPPSTGVPTPEGVERVGEAPPELEMPEIAVLRDQGSIVTRAGQLSFEPSFEYTRADRNRTLFRGIELVEGVLIGVFDINESRQDLVTEAVTLRYGILDELEVSARVPLVYRSDKLIVTPSVGPGGQADEIDSSTDARGLGDIEVTARYQLLAARNDLPYLIANLQLTAPTGSSPFEVARTFTGRPLEAATGAGFWSLSPGLTAITRTDPAVIFGTISYTRNFGQSVDVLIPPVRLVSVNPGDSIGASLGLGISLNQRTSFNLGYSHSWVFGTKTESLLLEPDRDGSFGPIFQTSRDLQLGRLLFGISHRMNNRVTLNWSVEVGATEDAADVRTYLRLPILVNAGD
ncbi:MAG: transporter [Allosphingosinicella sp.]